MVNHGGYRAKYVGDACSKCQQPIKIGQYITWSRKPVGWDVFHRYCFDQPGLLTRIIRIIRGASQ